MKFEIYKSRVTYRGRLIYQPWRWRLTASNGRIVAASSQAFVSKQGAKTNAKLTRDRMAAITDRQWDQA